MKLPCLIDLSLMLILASYSKGQTWDVNVTRNICASPGSDVTISCTFTYPVAHHTKNVRVYWKRLEKSRFDTKDNDKNEFIFHTNETFVIDKYRGRTKLIGNKDKGDCSLKIQNVTGSDSRIYVRVIGQGNQYSFIKQTVSISVLGDIQVTGIPDITNAQSTLPTSKITTNEMAQETSTLIYLAIFVPVAALLIIIFVTGIVFCIKHKRSKSFTRGDSGYYANFRRASSNQANREAPHKKQDNKKLPEPKVIDEPVYINMEAQAPDQMAQIMDHTDNVYANVDYSK